MRPVFDHSLAAAAVEVACYACGRMLRLSDCVIDADGPRFRAYYHVACLPQDAVLPERCAHDGCERDHGASRIPARCDMCKVGTDLTQTLGIPLQGNSHREAWLCDACRVRLGFPVVE